MGNSKPVLGVDIGNVIIGSRERSPVHGKDRYADSTFLNGDRDAALATPATPGSFAAIRELLPLFGGRIWLVSKCGWRIQHRTEAWLWQHRFYTYTGLPADHVRFCKHRSGKGPICQELEVTHFVDDRPDIIASLEGVAEHRYLFGPQEGDCPEGATAVASWMITRQLIRRTFIHGIAQPSQEEEETT
jgi:hypothetical protein